MKIYSMTATFGKLERQILELKDGLNIIERPNEWGKSTWCAFIIDMLYGIDTKARTTQTVLADKERYAPWSGAPMEGRMDLCWQGRNITIERRTRGRLIFGDFRAYETESGMDVPELTASNCGMELLGVERSVFARAGFLKLSDMPVTQDDALRRRLNNLVTTGDENSAGDKLAQELKDQKNKCRNNRGGGLLPKAEEERDELAGRLRELQDLMIQSQRLGERQKELNIWIAKLENHKAFLRHAAAQEDLQHIREAEKAYEQAQLQRKVLEEECARLPAADQAQRTRDQLQKLRDESLALQLEQQMLPLAPAAPICKPCFMGKTPEQAMEQAKSDAFQAEKLEKKKTPLIGIGIAVLLVGVLVAAGGFLLRQLLLPLLLGGGAALLTGILLLAMGMFQKGKNKKQLAELTEKYGTPQTGLWIQDTENFARQQQIYQEESAQYRQSAEQFTSHRESLLAQIQAVTGGEDVGVCLERWNKIDQKWKALGDARRDEESARKQVDTLKAITKDVPAPKFPDELTQSAEETDALLNSASSERDGNNRKLGELKGKSDALGQEDALRRELKQKQSRIDRLEEIYSALELAQRTLADATSALQRRFAPRIAKRSQELFGLLTGGRYDKVMLQDDLSVQVSAEDETTLRSSQWRSDGTVDQLYLALRLAVAEELTPDAPLVLDDAMVRFDDIRLRSALDILEQIAKDKQVILFTCQSREMRLQGENNE